MLMVDIFIVMLSVVLPIVIMLDVAAPLRKSIVDLLMVTAMMLNRVAAVLP
jgi:hypothetical protein